MAPRSPRAMSRASTAVSVRDAGRRHRWSHRPGVLAVADSSPRTQRGHVGLAITAAARRPGLGGDVNYDAFDVRYPKYLSLRPDLVLATDLHGCARSGDVPLS